MYVADYDKGLYVIKSHDDLKSFDAPKKIYANTEIKGVTSIYFATLGAQYLYMGIVIISSVIMFSLF